MEEITKHNGKLLGKIIVQGGVAGIAIIALVLVVWMKLEPAARPDAYTRSQAEHRAALVDDRLARIEAAIEAHIGIDAHGGAGRQLAAIQATLAAIQTNLARLERKLEGR
jgi:hypothetical protein